MTHVSIAPKRNAIVAHARAWIGTPYHHQASRIGVGTDCLGLIRGVFRALYGHEVRAYPRLRARLGRRRRRGNHARRRPPPPRRNRSRPPLIAGDVLIFRYRQRICRQARRASWPVRTIIHAIEGAPVSEVPLTNWWRRRIAGAFSFPGVTG